MRKFALFIFAIAMLVFVSSSFAGVGFDNGYYIINLSSNPAQEDGVINLSAKTLLTKIANESLDKTKKIQVIGSSEQTILIKKVGSFYGYKVDALDSNSKNVSSYANIADMPISNFLLSEKAAGEDVTLEKMLNAFTAVEKSGYDVAKLNDALDLLTKTMSILPSDLNNKLFNLWTTDKTVSAFVQDMINSLSSGSNAKDVQYSVIVDQVGQIVGPILGSLLSSLTPIIEMIFPGGVIPPYITRIGVLNLMFPALDVVLNMPLVGQAARLFFMDLVAPIMSHAH